jgi:hypothetical protein
VFTIIGGALILIGWTFAICSFLVAKFSRDESIFYFARLLPERPVWLFRLAPLWEYSH